MITEPMTTGSSAAVLIRVTIILSGVERVIVDRISV